MVLENSTTVVSEPNGEIHGLDLSMHTKYTDINMLIGKLYCLSEHFCAFKSNFTFTCDGLYYIGFWFYIVKKRFQRASILSMKKKVRKKSSRLPHIIPKIKRTHSVTEAKTPTHFSRGHKSDPGSVYIDIAMSPNGQ